MGAGTDKRFQDCEETCSKLDLTAPVAAWCSQASVCVLSSCHVARGYLDQSRRLHQWLMSSQWLGPGCAVTTSSSADLARVELVLLLLVPGEISDVTGDKARDWHSCRLEGDGDGDGEVMRRGVSGARKRTALVSGR